MSASKQRNVFKPGKGTPDCPDCWVNEDLSVNPCRFCGRREFDASELGKLYAKGHADPNFVFIAHDSTDANGVRTIIEWRFVGSRDCYGEPSGHWFSTVRVGDQRKTNGSTYCFNPIISTRMLLEGLRPNRPTCPACSAFMATTSTLNGATVEVTPYCSNVLCGKCWVHGILE